MRKRFVVAMLATFSCIFFGLDVHNVAAVSADIVISRVQTKSLTGGSASQELVELYNNSDSDTDITDWCVEYGQKSIDMVTLDPLASSVLACFQAPAGGDSKLMVSARSPILLISKTLNEQYPMLGYDAIFNSGLADTDRWLRVKNASHAIVDKVEWSGSGSSLSVSAEGGKTAPSQTTTLLIQRKISLPSYLQDTDNNFEDFERSPPPATYSYGSVYELEDVCVNIAEFQSIVPMGYLTDEYRNCLPPPVDICTNIDGVQTILPEGYELDPDNLCVPDVCVNIIGLQTTMPVGKEFDIDGNCIDRDVCTNLPGIQTIAPSGFLQEGDDRCVLGLLPLQLTELLPNADGSDDDSEFIELYNPNDVGVSLMYYLFYVGVDSSSIYSFPVGAYVEPHQYLAFYNADINFTLVNSSSSVTLRALDNTSVSQSPIYSNPKSGESWALIDGVWQYTNQPTPNLPNSASIIETSKLEDDQEVSGVKPCAANQYRNPETNRCRLLVTIGAVLVPCKDGQYRSEETNRCRSIASDSGALSMCNEGQERNPATNRCRLIASSGYELVACKEGQERNPDTNRCRNVVGSLPQAPFGVEEITSVPSSTVSWWVLGGVVLAALVYGVWEWKFEIKNLLRRIYDFIHASK